LLHDRRAKEGNYCPKKRRRKQACESKSQEECNESIPFVQIQLTHIIKDEQSRIRIIKTGARYAEAY
jgi:hypothetical protein